MKGEALRGKADAWLRRNRTVPTVGNATGKAFCFHHRNSKLYQYMFCSFVLI